MLCVLCFSRFLYLSVVVCLFVCLFVMFLFLVFGLESTDLGRRAFVILAKLHVEYTNDHVWGPLGAWHMAISIVLLRTCIHFEPTFAELD